MAQYLPRIFDRYLLRRTRSLRAVTQCIMTFWTRGESQTTDDGVIFMSSLPSSLDMKNQRATIALVKESNNLACDVKIDSSASDPAIEVHYLATTTHLPLIIFQALLNNQHQRNFHVVHRLGLRKEGPGCLVVLSQWRLFDMRKVQLPSIAEPSAIFVDGQWLQIDMVSDRHTVSQNLAELSSWSCSVVRVALHHHIVHLTLLYDLSQSESQRCSCLLIQRHHSQPSKQEAA